MVHVPNVPFRSVNPKYGLQRLNLRERFSRLYNGVVALLGSSPAMLLICLYWALFAPLVSCDCRALTSSTRILSQKGGFLRKADARKGGRGEVPKPLNLYVVGTCAAF